MEVKIPSRLLFLIVFFSLLLTAFFSSGLWHEFVPKKESVSFQLLSYDQRVSFNERACFSLLIETTNLESQKTRPLLVTGNGESVFADKIKIGGDAVKEYCFGVQELGEKNLIEVSVGDETLFFELNKVSSLTKKKPSIEIESVDSGTLFFSVNNFPTHKIAPIKITVNGKLDHRVYPKNNSEQFSEKLKLKEGENEIVVSTLSVSEETQASYQKPFTLPLIAGVFLLGIGLFVFFCFVFGERNFIEGSALSLASLVCLLVLNGFLLDWVNLLNTAFFVLVLLGELLFLAFLFRNKFSLKKVRLKKIQPHLIEVIVLLFFLFVSLGLQLFVPSHQSPWSVYYERQANTVAENFGIPKTDTLSYLGRSFSFTPGYFLLEGAFYWLTGCLGQQLFALTVVFSNLLFLLSALFLARALKLKRKASMLFVVFLSMSTFVFTTFTITPRHAIALSLLFVGLALSLKKREWWMASIFLGVGFFVQLPLALFYLFLVPFLMKKIDWSRIGKIFAGGLILFAPLYSFIPLTSGFPFQIMSESWGYLISLPFHSLIENPGVLFVFFSFYLVFELFQFFNHKSKWDSFKKRLFFGVLLAMSLQLLVSSRLDLVSGVLIAVFLAYSLEKYKKQLTVFSELLMGFILLFGLFLAIAAMPYHMHSPELNAALNSLKENSSTNTRVLCDPYYGHLIAFKSKRITLADPMVEYADPKKFTDSYKFLEEKDYSVLKKYGIDIVFSEKHSIHSSPLETKKVSEPLEFREMDKFFSNSLISMHRQR